MRDLPITFATPLLAICSRMMLAMTTLPTVQSVASWRRAILSSYINKLKSLEELI